MDATREITGENCGTVAAIPKKQETLTMYDYELMLDLDELTLAFEHCGIIEIPLNNPRLRRAALVLEESGLIENVGKSKTVTAYAKVS